jgi:cation diffusion facilitator CzcD-associated flavoprotein CzcO
VIARDVIIIGTGFSGMGAAAKMLEAGRTDFLVLEKADDVGGTWRDNTYPGAECDIPSHMYSFSWALNPDWTRNFSAQPEIWAYMRKVADDTGIRPYIQFGVEVTGASWDDERSVWTIRTKGGDDYEARVVLSGVGGLHIPLIPEIPGAESFAGPRFHSAGWDHSVDLKGKKVAVVGTGASAIQFIPIIAEEVGHMTVFQRTPPWVLGKRDNPIHPVRQKFFDRVPGLTRAYRNAIYWALESRAIAFNGHLNVLPLAEKLAKKNIERAIKDPELVRKLTPSYRLGCKRVLQSNTYYPTFARDNVDLVTDHIKEIVPDGIIDEAGVKHEFDVIIYGTGFHVVDAFDYLDIKGRGGRDLASEFRENGVETYLGMTVHGYPNLYFMLGPNTALGHNSVVFMIEQQTKYLLNMLDEMDARGAAAADVKKQPQDEYNEEIQRLVSKGIWTQGGCKSWYLDAQGKNRTIWPKFTFQYWSELRKVKADDYEWTPRVPAEEKVAS